MRVKLSIKIPSSSGSVLASRVTSAFRAAIERARPRIVALVVDRASAAVDKLVPEFAPRYKAALRARDAVVVTDREITIKIADPVVSAVELGAAAFDMKPKLLARGKTSKSGGVYVDVPIQHKPGSVPQAIRTAGRRLARTIPDSPTVRLRATTPGKSFTRELHRGPISRALGIGPRKQEVKHKRGIYDDVIRTSSTRRYRGSSVSYTTVRRVSSNSSPSSWFHPGFKPRKALDYVLPKAREDIAKIISESMSSKSSGK